MAKKATVAPAKTDVLEALVKTFLEKNKQAGILEKEMKTLKAEITAHGDNRIAEFVDGELILGAGTIKIALNPPKMYFDQTGKAVEAPERAAIALIVPDAYKTLDLNTKLIKERQSADKILAQVLKSQGVVIRQETRYDVKANKA